MKEYDSIDDENKYAVNFLNDYINDKKLSKILQVVHSGSPVGVRKLSDVIKKDIPQYLLD